MAGDLTLWVAICSDGDRISMFETWGGGGARRGAVGGREETKAVHTRGGVICVESRHRVVSQNPAVTVSG